MPLAKGFLKLPMIQSFFKTACIVRVGVIKSVMFWAAGDNVSLSSLGKLLLGARVKGRAGELVLSLRTTFGS